MERNYRSTYRPRALLDPFYSPGGSRYARRTYTDAEGNQRSGYIRKYRAGARALSTLARRADPGNRLVAGLAKMKRRK